MDPLVEPFLQYGVLGVVAAVLIVLARNLIKREQDRADASAAEVIRLNNLMIEKTIPALVSATTAVTSAQAILQAIKYQQDIEAATAAKAAKP